MSQFSTLTDLLRQHGYHVTSTRKRVFLALRTSGPCTVSELIHVLTPKTNRASIYRTIQLFEELGVARRIQIGWKYKLELGDGFSEHHHHAHCSSCGNIISLPENHQLERLITADAKRQNFTITEHSLELYGYCENCQK